MDKTAFVPKKSKYLFETLWDFLVYNTLYVVNGGEKRREFESYYICQYFELKVPCFDFKFLQNCFQIHLNSGTTHIHIHLIIRVNIMNKSPHDDISAFLPLKYGYSNKELRNKHLISQYIPNIVNDCNFCSKKILPITIMDQIISNTINSNNFQHSRMKKTNIGMLFYFFKSIIKNALNFIQWPYKLYHCFGYT